MSSHDKVRSLYRMMFPLGEFKGDYLSACLNMRREIKNMCKNEFKLPLLMMISVLEMKPKPTISTPVSELCRTVRLNLEDYCLGLGDQEGAQTLINMKTGTIVRESPSTICEKFYGYISDYDYGDDYDDFLIVDLYRIGGLLRPFRFTNDVKEYSINDILSSFHNNLGKYSIKQEEDFIGLISELVINDKVFDRIERQARIILTLQDKEFLIYLHNLFLNRKIPLDIEAEEICNNPEILKFKSSVGL